MPSSMCLLHLVGGPPSKPKVACVVHPSLSHLGPDIYHAIILVPLASSSWPARKAQSSPRGTSICSTLQQVVGGTTVVSQSISPFCIGGADTADVSSHHLLPILSAFHMTHRYRHPKRSSCLHMWLALERPHRRRADGAWSRS